MSESVNPTFSQESRGEGVILRPGLAVLAGLVLALAWTAEPLRAETWTDASGKHTLEADFADVKAGEVYLKRKADGVTIKVPFKQLSAASQQLARQIYASRTKAKPAATEFASPDAMMQGASKALETGNLRTHWELLPPAYQKDINGFIRTFAANMDAELWQAGVGLLNKGVQVLEQKKAFVLAHPQIPAQLRELIDYDQELAFLKAVASSDLVNLTKLKTFDVGAFLDGSGKKVLEQLGVSASQAAKGRLGIASGWLAGIQIALQGHKFTTVKQDGDTATLRDEFMTFPPVESPWVRVDRKWLPKSLVDGWPARVAEGQAQLAALTPQLQQSKPQALAMMTALNKILDGMLAAKTQAEFNQAADSLISLVSAANPAAQAQTSINNLKEIGIGLQNFHDVYKKFPAQASPGRDGKPLLSWRVAILPFVGGRGLYDQFHRDEPWDSEHNRKLIVQMPPVYAAPALPADMRAKGMTTYLAPVGTGTIFGGTEGTSFATITDGTSNTIIVVEAAPAKAVIWTKPDDLAIDPKDPRAGLTGQPSRGFHALMADGSVHRLVDSIDPQMLLRLFQRNDGQPVSIP